MERMTEAEKLKQRMSRDNPYNSFGSDNFLNANTGKEVRMVTERWEYKHYVDNPESTIDNKIEALTYNLPESIDLKDIKNKLEYDYNDFSSKEFITKEELKNQSIGFIKSIVNNINKNILTENKLDIKYDSYEDMIYYKYLIKLPKYLLLEDLEDEQFNNDVELIKKFKNSEIHQNINLASLPEETLRFLLKKYK